MKLLLRSQLRSLWRNKTVSLAVLMSLALSVMSVLVVHEIGRSLVEGMDTHEITRGYDFTVRLPEHREESYFQLRQEWRNGSLPKIVAMVPVIEGTVEHDGKLIKVLGFDPLADRSFTGVTLGAITTDFSFLVRDSLIAFGGVAQRGVKLNNIEVIESFASGRPQLIGDIPSVQALLDRHGELDAVWLAKRLDRTKTWYEALMPGIQSALRNTGPMPELDGFTIQQLSAWNPSREFTNAIVFQVGILGILAMFVAAFIIFQTIANNRRMRRTEFDRLHTLGVSTRQITSSYALDSTILGAVGSAVGLVGGLLFLSAIENRTLVEIGSRLSWIGVAKAAILGLVLTIAVGCLAGKTNRRSLTKRTRTLIGISGVLFVLIGFSASSGLFGAYLLILGMCVFSIAVIAPALLGMFVRFATALRTGSSRSRMNLRNSLTDIQATKLAIQALSIAVATAIGIGLMVSSFKTEFSDLLDNRLAPALHVANAANVDIDQIRTIAGVGDVREYYRAEGTLKTGPVALTATELDGWETARYAYPDEIVDGLMINEIATRQFKLKRGSPLDIALPSGQLIHLPVVHVYKDYGDGSARVILPLDFRTDEFIRDRLSILGDTAEFEKVSAFLAKNHPEVEIASSDEIRRIALAVFDQSFVLTTAIANIALLVATFGMAGSLVVLQSKRLGELRLLHAMGMSKLEIGRLTVVQCAQLGLVAVVCAIPLSIGIAWALCEIVQLRAFNWSIDLKWHWLPFLIPAMLGVLAAVVAGLIPLRRSLKQLVNQPLTNAL